MATFDSTTKEQLSQSFFWDFEEFTANDLSSLLWMGSLAVGTIGTSFYIWPRGSIEVLAFVSVVVFAITLPTAGRGFKPKRSISMLLKELEICLANFKGVKTLGLSQYCVEKVHEEMKSQICKADWRELL